MVLKYDYVNERNQLFHVNDGDEDSQSTNSARALPSPTKKSKLMASYTTRQSSSQSATGNSLQQLNKYFDVDDDEECLASGTETNLVSTSWFIQHLEHLDAMLFVTYEKGSGT